MIVKKNLYFFNFNFKIKKSLFLFIYCKSLDLLLFFIIRNDTNILVKVYIVEITIKQKKKNALIYI